MPFFFPMGCWERILDNFDGLYFPKKRKETSGNIILKKKRLYFVIIFCFIEYKKLKNTFENQKFIFYFLFLKTENIILF